MNDTLIDDTRAFNRFYTRVVGALDEHLTESPFSLAEARVLYEIAARGRTTGSELAKALGLDRAYLTRILQGFAGKELVSSSPIPGDRRLSAIALSPAGERVFADLQARAEEAVAKLLEPLPPLRRTPRPRIRRRPAADTPTLLPEFSIDGVLSGRPTAGAKDGHG